MKVDAKACQYVGFCCRDDPVTMVTGLIGLWVACINGTCVEIWSDYCHKACTVRYKRLVNGQDSRYVILVIREKTRQKCHGIHLYPSQIKASSNTSLCKICDLMESKELKWDRLCQVEINHPRKKNCTHTVLWNSFVFVASETYIY